MHEYTANFHQHTTASDGAGTHAEVIKAGAEANLQVMVFTDHNVYVPNIEGWYGETLVLMGIEVNDTGLEPELNHYLCLGVDRDLNDYAADPQALINAVNDCGGVGFIAHPFERPAGPPFKDDIYPWLNWDVQGYTGLEIWNYMSETKAHVTGRLRAIHLAYRPSSFITAPFPETLNHWDALTQNGQKVVAIGGSDAHGATYSMGPLRRVVYPYPYLFSAIRTHLLLPEPLSKTITDAKGQVLAALRQGHCFVAYDRIGDTTGFRFTATHSQGQIMQGDEISLALGDAIQLTTTTPVPAEIHLLKNGALIAQTQGQTLTQVISEAGIYRVECYRMHRKRQRGWIYSNPIYVKPL